MIRKVMVAGGGVLGSQIALQTAVSGFDVTVYDIVEEGLIGAKEKMKHYIPRYASEAKKDYPREDLEQALNTSRFTTDLAEAAKDADLIIEAIVEKLPVKKQFYNDLKLVAPEQAIFATNTSTLKPSDFMDATGRPEKFLALHFANEIWYRNTAEVMRTERTSDATFQAVLDFSENIGMVPIPIYKEHPAYILNSLLNPYLSTSLYLLGKQVASPQDIDRVWMKGTQSNQGPFGVIDHVGIETPKNILEGLIRTDQLPKEDWVNRTYETFQQMLAEGKGGKLQGEGFYNYAGEPEFLKDDFLDRTPDIHLTDYHMSSGDKEKERALRIYSAIMTQLLEAALSLYVHGISEATLIDKVWKITRGLDWGPFSFIKQVGAEKVYEIFKERYGDHPTTEQTAILDALKVGTFEPM